MAATEHERLEVLAGSQTVRRVKGGPSATKSPKGGRPTADRAAAISRAILDSATRVFLAEGFDGASMGAIAAAAGVPKTTLYKRYADKKLLLRAVLKDRVSSWEPADRHASLGDDLEDRMKGYAAAMLTRAASGEVRAFMGLVASAWSGAEGAASRREVMGATEMLQRLADDIRRYGPTRGIHAANPERVAVTLMATLAGWLTFTGDSPGVSEQSATEFAHSAVDILFRGSASW